MSNNSKPSTIKEDLDFTSSQISNLMRYVGFGLVGICFSILNSSSESTINIFNENKLFFSLSAILGCITILLDYLQLLSGYSISYKTFYSNKQLYNKKSLFYRLRFVFFYSKQITAISGTILIIYILISTII